MDSHALTTRALMVHTPQDGNSPAWANRVDDGPAPRKNRRRPLNLWEALLRLAAAALLALLLIPVAHSLGEGPRPKVPSCLGAQRKIAFAALLYAKDHGEVLPPPNIVWDELCSDPSMLHCQNAPNLRYPYAYNGAGEWLGDIKDPGVFVLTYDARDGKPHYRHNRKLAACR